MRRLGGLLVLLILIFSCGQSKSEKGHDPMSGLADTLQFRKIILQIEGMTSEGCEKSIAAELGKLDGIAEVTVSHVDSIATILFDTSVANVVFISEKINDLGYRVISEITP
jgi:copper chaperone CopZ